MTLKTIQTQYKDVLIRIGNLFAVFDFGYPQALDQVLQHTLDLVGGKFALYNRFDMERGKIFTWNGCHLPSGFRQSGDLKGRICYEALYKKNDCLVIFEDLKNTVFWHTDPDVRKYKLRFYLGYPVFLNGQKIGSLCVFDEQPKSFHAMETIIIEMFAKILSFLEKRFLVENTLEKKLLYEKMLAAIATKAINVQDIDAFLNHCLLIMGKTLGLDAAEIYLINPESHVFKSSCYWQVSGQLKKNGKELLSTRIAADVTTSRAVMQYADIEKLIDNPDKPFFINQNIRSILLLPLFNQERLNGLCSLKMLQPRYWTEEDIDIVKTVTRIIAHTIESKTITRQLDESEALIRQMVELAPTGIYRIDFVTLRFLKVNDYMCRILGYTEEELLRMNPGDLLTPESRQLFLESLQQVAYGEDFSPDYEFQFITKSGSVEWAHLKGRHLYEDGKLTGAMVVARVITEQKRAQEELSNYRKKLEILVQERTRELSEVNRQLHREIEQRAKTAKELELNTERLEELNTAMRVLLDKRTEEHARLEENIKFNLRELIEPYLLRLQNSNLSSTQKQLLGVISDNLNEVLSSPMPELSSEYYIFSPSELQVANLIRKGKTTKEMANLLNLSTRTIESYRNSIRKKLGIKNKKINLKTYLVSKQ